MKTTTTSIVIEALIQILEAEGVDLNSINFNLQGDETQVPFTKLIDLAKRDLEQIQTESTRLDFLLENRIRVEKWHTNPSSEFYFVMNEDDASIARAKDGRDAIDEAMAIFAGEAE
ncbi:hypothetical protein N5B96_03110 [Acinetobacter johnsonii]|uniref:hypothetical protein n=1 Tax=Acinetobacter johnsonii TaxID=40214 RepID=UPI00244BC25F|nr:hypothetical protein [Acinetobacter johnsonii]MDH1068489.1 hypothetical protein [Acinetobacter johnsonii]